MPRDHHARFVFKDLTSHRKAVSYLTDDELQKQQAPSLLELIEERPEVAVTAA